MLVIVVSRIIQIKLMKVIFNPVPLLSSLVYSKNMVIFFTHFNTVTGEKKTTQNKNKRQDAGKN